MSLVWGMHPVLASTKPQIRKNRFKPPVALVGWLNNPTFRPQLQVSLKQARWLMAGAAYEKHRKNKNGLLPRKTIAA